MKNMLAAILDRVVRSLQKYKWGMVLLTGITGFLSRVINREVISIENHQGYWFRRNANRVITIGTRLRMRISEIRSWKSHHVNEFFAMRSKWWFRSYTPGKGDFIIDVGAGMGEDTYVFSEAVGPSGFVLAIEAHPATYKALSLFVQLNGLTNVKSENLAASDSDGTLWMSSLPEDDWQCNSLITGKDADHGIEVHAMRIDDIPGLTSAASIAFMKINIEGAEVLALHGAGQTLQKTKNICVCCHDFIGPDTRTKDEVSSILMDAGFELSFTSPDSPPYERDFVYGSKRSH